MSEPTTRRQESSAAAVPNTEPRIQLEVDDVFIPAVLFLSMAASPANEIATNYEPVRIQVQRQVGHRKALELGAGIVQEFVEIGSASTLSKRHAMKTMLTYLGQHSAVRYAIFPGPQRFSRNIGESLMLQERFEELDVKVYFSQGPIETLHAAHPNVGKSQAELIANPNGRRHI